MRRCAYRWPSLLFRIRNMAALTIAFAGAAEAQSAAARFVLPEKPFDYTIPLQPHVRPRVWRTSRPFLNSERVSKAPSPVLSTSRRRISSPRW